MKKMHGLTYTLLALLISFKCHAFDMQTRIAFYYGDNPSMDELHAFQVVVVQPDQRLSPDTYNNASSQLYAYVSVGELHKESKYIFKTKKWQKGENKAWNSIVMDMANPKWRLFLLDHIITPAWNKGYRGFFLDTLDSYQLLKLTDEEKQQQKKGIRDLVYNIKKRHPKAKIIVNRGFEIIHEVHEKIDAVAAESLFAAWNEHQKTYGSVSQLDREWLLEKLNNIKKKYHLPVIVIDYVPPQQRRKTRRIAREIKQAGFIPWVTDAHLHTLGIGLVEVIPRRVLLLYNEGSHVPGTPLNQTKAYNFAAFPLQFMGFIPELKLADPNLPKDLLTDRYAGIITWFDKPVIKHHHFVQNWLKKHINNGLPVIFMQNFGVPQNASFLTFLNIQSRKSLKNIKQVSISYQDKMTGYEIMPQPLPSSFQAVSSKDGTVLLEITAGEQKEDAIAITPWGGYVLSPFDMVGLPNGESRWVINPFLFFQKALRLPDIPIPDVTTANGRRILTVHIDGDAFTSRVPWLDNKYAGDVIYEQILKTYKLPATVSLIQREFELLSPYPALQKHLTETAKAIYSLPWTEAATHTYSHPLYWGKLVEGKILTFALSYPSDNYRFSYEKEIVGSSQFINQHFTPPGKKVETVFWSGDANLKEEPLKVAYQNHLKNINGMSKLYLNSNRSITNLAALGIYIGQYFHIFSPIPNEFVYTEDWSAPLYRFQNVIHSFILTNKPFRYKPVSIYYHFYSAVDQGALRALKRVYRWSLKQKTIPLQIIDYINKVLDFNHTVIARSLDDQQQKWLIANNKNLKEFRRPVSQLKPDITRSSNVTGYNIHNDDYYIHLGTEATSWLTMSNRLSHLPYLVEANAEIMQWDIINDKKIHFSLKGYVPLQFKLANMKGCQLVQNNQLLNVEKNQYYSIKDKNSGTFEIRCQGAAKAQTRGNVFLWISHFIRFVYQWTVYHLIPWK